MLRSQLRLISIGRRMRRAAGTAVPPGRGSRGRTGALGTPRERVRSLIVDASSCGRMGSVTDWAGFACVKNVSKRVKNVLFRVIPVLERVIIVSQRVILVSGRVTCASRRFRRTDGEERKTDGSSAEAKNPNDTCGGELTSRKGSVRCGARRESSAVLAIKSTLLIIHKIDTHQTQFQV
jgi:hypothetical protein